MLYSSFLHKDQAQGLVLLYKDHHTDKPTLMPTFQAQGKEGKHHSPGTCNTTRAFDHVYATRKFTLLQTSIYKVSLLPFSFVWKCGCVCPRASMENVGMHQRVRRLNSWGTVSMPFFKTWRSSFTTPLH